jgi:hypothetical protein
VNVPEGITVKFAHDLNVLLGLGRETYSSRSFEGVNPVNLLYKIQALFIYCDIIDDQTIGGNESWKLLRFLPVSNTTFGDVTTRFYDNPQYIPLSNKQFESIHIKLCDQALEVIPFQKGISVVQLHFRLLKIPFF